VVLATLVGDSSQLPFFRSSRRGSLFFDRYDYAIALDRTLLNKGIANTLVYAYRGGIKRELLMDSRRRVNSWE
jgi:hypothetical protein